jgi:N-acetylneuraminate lyase
MNKSKYSGIIPAFYACYDESGNINGEAIEVFAELLINKGVKGVYVGGSSGECIYQSVAERKLVLERVMRVARGRITVIAHVAANNTKDSCELAAHAESLGVDAIAAIPPIYFHLPDYAIIDYWNSISEAAPNTDFIIYNIPQLAGVALSPAALKKMLENPRVIGVKNSSMPVIDIQTFKAIGGENFIVFNGPDEQLAGGLAMGAIGGIGGTYGVIPELYIKIKELVDAGDVKGACDLQQIANEIISMLVSCHGNLYAVIKEIIKIREGINLGSVRSPLPSLIDKDMPKVIATAKRIDEVINSL